MGFNEIRDISGIQNLAELKFLTICQNPIRDFRPLKKLTKLVDVSLGQISLVSGLMKYLGTENLIKKIKAHSLYPNSNLEKSNREIINTIKKSGARVYEWN